MTKLRPAARQSPDTKVNSGALAASAARRTTLPPPSYHIDVPDDLGRTPRADDITIFREFTGRTPEEAVAEMLRDQTIHPSHTNIQAHAHDVLRRFVAATANVFVAGSPARNWLDGRGVTELEILGSMQLMNAVVYALPSGGEVQDYWHLDENRAYVPLPQRPLFVALHARVVLAPEPGLEVTYPTWSNPVLALEVPAPVIIGHGGVLGDGDRFGD